MTQHDSQPYLRRPSLVLRPLEAVLDGLPQLLFLGHPRDGATLPDLRGHGVLEADGHGALQRIVLGQGVVEPKNIWIAIQ